MPQPSPYSEEQDQNKVLADLGRKLVRSLHSGEGTSDVLLELMDRVMAEDPASFEGPVGGFGGRVLRSIQDTL